MDAAAAGKLAYWTWAFANMLLLVGLASLGVRRARARQVAAHRRFMLSAAALVALFVGSYVAKVIALGREPLQAWEPFYVAVRADAPNPAPGVPTRFARASSRSKKSHDASPFGVSSHRYGAWTPPCTVKPAAASPSRRSRAFSM